MLYQGKMIRMKLRFLFIISIVATAFNCIAQNSYLVYNINTSGNSYPMFLTPMGGKLYFFANDGSKGWELWSADGTNAPSNVQDINPGSSGITSPNFQQPVCELNNKLYFAADNGVVGSELYTCNGSTATLAWDIEAGAAGSYPDNLTVLNGNIFFRASTTGSGTELWKYTPFTNTMTALKEINSGQDSSITGNLIAFNNNLYYTASTPGNGNELWYYDQLQDTNIMVSDINPGNLSADPLNLVVYNGKLYFSAVAAATGRELYSCDASNNVQRLTDLVAGFASGLPTYTHPMIAGYNGKIYFNGRDANNEYHMFVYDPATSNATLAFKTNTTGSSDPLWMKAQNSLLYFAATGTTNGNEVWTYNGATFTILADFCNGGGSSDPEEITAIGNDLYFRGNECGGKGIELFRYNPQLNVEDHKPGHVAALFPNPAENDVTATVWTHGNEDLKITISDITGRVIYNAGAVAKNDGLNNINIPVNNFTAGTYICTITGSNGEVLLKEKLLKI